MAMVKIDGGKVRQLREQKSLTQLYVATAVQVTTDTISRWENRRYPTIKKENALRLAEALEVDLEEILDRQPEPPAELNGETFQEENLSSDHNTIGKNEIGKRRVYVRLPILLFSATIAALIGFVGWFFLNMETPTIVVTANRSLPTQCTQGQVFPVSLEVNVESNEPIAFIIKEQLPEGVKVVNSAPPLSSSGKEGNILKWLKKGQGKLSFTYTAIIEDEPNGFDEFSGVVSINDQSTTPHTTSGDHKIEVGNYHWADSNRDNVLSDSEILTVYDQFGETDELGIDLDLIEEIWLGSGYTWNPETKKYDILP